MPRRHDRVRRLTITVRVLGPSSTVPEGGVELGLPPGVAARLRSTHWLAVPRANVGTAARRLRILAYQASAPTTCARGTGAARRRKAGKPALRNVARSAVWNV